MENLQKFHNDGLIELAKLLLQKEAVEAKLTQLKAQLTQIEVVMQYEKDKEAQAKEAEVVEG